MKKKNLKTLQEWFGSAIALPLNLDHLPAKINKEANSFLREKNGLKGEQRLRIYNQQYWFRLITIMQVEYPCAVKLLGYENFNRYAMDYLQAYPSQSVFLEALDQNFYAFMESNFRGKGRKKILQALAFDRALSKAVDGENAKGFQSGKSKGDGKKKAKDSAPILSELISQKIILAGHLTPLHLDWDWDAFRSKNLPIAKNTEIQDVIIYRDENYHILIQPLSKIARRILELFKEPKTLSQAFKILEKELSVKDQALLEKNLSEWFQLWVQKKWIGFA